MTWRAQGVMTHEWLATCVPVQDVLSQGIMSTYDLWHFRVFERKPCVLPPIGGSLVSWSAGLTLDWS